jgi:hypothetical protein
MGSARRRCIHRGASHLIADFGYLPLLHTLVEERAGERRSLFDSPLLFPLPACAGRGDENPALSVFLQDEMRPIHREEIFRRCRRGALVIIRANKITNRCDCPACSVRFLTLSPVSGGSVVWSPGFSRQGVDNFKRVKKFYAPLLSCAAPPEGGTPNSPRNEHGTAPEAFEALRR